MTQWSLRIECDEAVAGVLVDLLAARGADASHDAGGAVLARFEARPERILVDAVGAWLSNLDARGAKVATRAGDADWVDGWGGFFGVMRASDRVDVVPAELADGHDPGSGRVAVVLELTEAFGAGGHPATRMILEMMDAALAEREVARVLDVGAGSGLLAIAAAKLGAEAFGVEIDPAAAADGARNATLNGVGDRARVVAGSMDQVDGTFDVVVANLLASILVDLSDPIAAAASRDLLLSGIQPAYVDDVLAAYPGFDERERREEAGWIALWLTARPG